MTRRLAPLLALAALALPATASASGPELTVPKADLAASLRCPIDPATTAGKPIMFVTGTGATGDQGYLIGQDAFEQYGHPVCYVNFPDFTTADIQVSVQYLVYGLRREFKLGGRKVAAVGISQGGLLPRFALTYWPDLRRKVSDVVAAAGTQHGTQLRRAAARPALPARRRTGSRRATRTSSTRSTRSPTRRPATSRTRRSARSPTRRSSRRAASTRRRPSTAPATS